MDPADQAAVYEAAGYAYLASAAARRATGLKESSIMAEDLDDLAASLVTLGGGKSPHTPPAAAPAPTSPAPPPPPPEVPTPRANRRR